MISTQNPAACDKCFRQIQDIMHFTTTCLNVEEKIDTYIRIKGMTFKDQVDLSYLQIFLSRSKLEWDFDDITPDEPECLKEINEVKEEIDIKFIKGCADTELDELEYVNEISEEESEIKVIAENENSITLTVNSLTEESYLEPTEKYVEEIHIKNEEIKCEDDFSSFVERQTIQGSNLWMCKICTYGSKYRHCIARHILSHKNSSEVHLFRCPKCDFTTKYKGGLNRHMITHQDASEAKIYGCDECPFKTKHRYGMVKHSLIHKDASELTTFQCQECRRAFKRKEQLRNHVRTHMKPNLPKFKCEECDYATIRKDNLKVHTLIHKDASEVRMFRCHLCTYETKTKGSLCSHLATHMVKKTKKWHKCRVCQYKSMYLGFVTRHVRKKHKNWEGEGS